MSQSIIVAVNWLVWSRLQVAAGGIHFLSVEDSGVFFLFSSIIVYPEVNQCSHVKWQLERSSSVEAVLVLSVYIDVCDTVDCRWLFSNINTATLNCLNLIKLWTGKKLQSSQLSLQMAKVQWLLSRWLKRLNWLYFQYFFFTELLFTCIVVLCRIIINEKKKKTEKKTKIIATPNTKLVI